VARFLVAARDFSFLQIVNTGSGPNQLPVQRALRTFSLRTVDRDVKLSTRFHLELRLGMSGAIPPAPCMFLTLPVFQLYNKSPNKMCKQNKMK
jgi:hypothetical protein